MGRALRILTSTVTFVALASVRLAAQATEAVNSPDTISYTVVGDGHPSVVLVHGWSNTRTFWEPHVYELSQRYQVVIPDLASFGESTAHRSAWTMISFADDIEAVLDQVNAEAVVLVGFSMGGAAVIEVAARGRDDVIGVVVVDIFQDVGAGRSDEEIDASVQNQMEHWHNPDNLRVAVSAGASPALIRRYISRTPETVPDEWWQSFRAFFLWEREQLTQRLLLVEAPIRAINSDRIPTTVAEWRQHVPSFSVRVLNGVNHLGTIWERVDEFDEALVGFVEDFAQRAGREQGR